MPQKTAVILRISASTELGGNACANALVMALVVSEFMSPSHLGPNDGFVLPAPGFKDLFHVRCDLRVKHFTLDAASPMRPSLAMPPRHRPRGKCPLLRRQMASRNFRLQSSTACVCACAGRCKPRRIMANRTIWQQQCHRSESIFKRPCVRESRSASWVHRRPHEGRSSPSWGCAKGSAHLCRTRRVWQDPSHFQLRAVQHFASCIKRSQRITELQLVCAHIPCQSAA